MTIILYRYAKRSSSAHWDHDTLTLVEKRTYRQQMGYNTGMNAAGAGAVPGGMRPVGPALSGGALRK
jgi:hypothetical protein